MRPLMGVALLAATAPCLCAQSFMGPVRGFARSNFSHSHHVARTGAYYPIAFFDPLYPDYGSEPPAAPEPRVIVMQAPVVSAKASADVMPSAEPLLIELQDNQYVQLSGKKQSRVQVLPIGERSTTQKSPTAPVSANTPHNVVLVFRDGHTEEVSAYTIADGNLFASADYYTAGSWNRKIDLTALNLPETVKENQLRGISFRLPAAPNEVIVGP